MLIQDLPTCSKSELDSFFKNELLPKWRKGEPTLFRIKPEHVDSRIESTVKSVIASNGTYEKGERVIINSRPDALPLAVEFGHVLAESGYDASIIYGLAGDPSSISKLLKATPNRKSMEKIVDQYKAMVDFAQHWVVPYATPHGEPSKLEKNAISAFLEYVNKGLSGLSKKRDEGGIKSHDIVGFPVPHEARRLGLPLPKWETMLYSAMGVTKNDLDKEIDRTGYLKPLGKAYKGATLRIMRKGNFPVNLTMKLKDRPIFKDVGSVGQNAIFGSYFERITNIPPGELFMAPIEDSVDGEFYTKIPQVSERGTMEGVHVVFRNGRVVEASAGKGEEALRYYTGLLEAETAVKKPVYEAQNTIAELGIGVNPVLDFERITGNPLIDEKMKGIHIATGANQMMGGKTPGAISGIAVEHWDFIVGKIDAIVAD